MWKNYSSWKVSITDFWNFKTLRDRAIFLIRFAVLAPSSHNSQPWKFSIQSDAILLFPELTRSLDVSDPYYRNLYISLGCSLENILIASDYYGLQTTIQTLTDASTGMMGFKIIFTEMKKIYVEARKTSHLIFSITKRSSNRNRYSDLMPNQ